MMRPMIHLVDKVLFVKFFHFLNNHIERHIIAIVQDDNWEES